MNAWWTTEDAPVYVQTLTAASSAAVILDSHYKVTAKRVLVSWYKLYKCITTKNFCFAVPPLDTKTPFELLRIYSYQASALMLALTLALMLGSNTFISIATFTQSIRVSINTNIKTQMGFRLTQNVNAEVRCKKNFKVSMWYHIQHFFLNKNRPSSLLSNCFSRKLKLIQINLAFCLSFWEFR